MHNILDLLVKEEKEFIKLIKVSKGQIIFKEDELCHYLAVVVKGKFSISSFSYNGKEIIYNKINENELFGNNLLFSIEPRYRGDVIALVNSEIALIHKNDLLEIFNTNQTFLEEYLKLSNEFSKKLNMKIKLLSINSAEERFLYYLFIHGNNVQYQSISLLAKELNLERETLSRLISRLVKTRKIDKKNHFFKVI